jgi:hypothetical protein
VTGHQRLLPCSLLPGRLLGDALPNTAPRPAGPGYTLGQPGRPAKVRTLLVAIFDNSGSVTWPAGTDPLSNRFAEVDRAFSLVARRGAQHELGAVLHFDTPSSGEVGPLPITRSGMKRLRQGLRIPPDGAGSSRLGPSLHRAAEIAQAHPDHEVTLVVLSDFQLFDTDPSTVLAMLAAFPGTVHAVVLGSLKDAAIPTGSVTVTCVRQGDTPGAVAKAVFASLTRHRPGSRAFREQGTAPATLPPGSRHSSLISQQLPSAVSTHPNNPR